MVVFCCCSEARFVLVVRVRKEREYPSIVQEGIGPNTEGEQKRKQNSGFELSLGPAVYNRKYYYGPTVPAFVSYTITEFQNAYSCSI